MTYCGVHDTICQSDWLPSNRLPGEKAGKPAFSLRTDLTIAAISGSILTMKELYDIYAGIKCLGDIRICEDGIEPNVRRLVMICQSHIDTPDVFGIYLLHPYVEFATSTDYKFTPAETGLLYDILVQTDLIGTVYRRQLGKRLGGISTSLFNTLPWNDLRVEDGELVIDGQGNAVVDHRAATRAPAGIPCRDSRDGRWQFKQEELDDLNQLVAPFWRDFQW